MKHCPSCQTNYADDTLQFCLQDGTQLKTIPDTSAPTIALNETEAETVIRNTPAERINFNLQETQTAQTQEPQSQITRVAPQFIPPSAPHTAPQKSNTALAVGLTALGMLLLFGIIGVGALLYFGGKDKEIAQNKNSSENSGNLNSIPNANMNVKNSPTPTPTASRTPKDTNVNANTNQPSDFNSEEIKSEVSSSMYAWKSSMESGSLDAVMSHYADTLDYYYRSGSTSRSFVRNNKKRAFELYYTFRVNMTNMRITPDASGQKATVTFNKSWEFEGSDDRSAGTVRAQFQLTKIGGRWYITGEKDL